MIPQRAPQPHQNVELGAASQLWSGTRVHCQTLLNSGIKQPE